MEYSEDNDLKTIKEKHSYQYDKDSQIIHEESSLNWEGQSIAKKEVKNYQYDFKGQLVNSIVQDENQNQITTEYSYDNVGNRTEMIVSTDGKENPSGHWIETAMDIASLGLSVSEFMNKPSWVSAGSLVWDIGATFLPFVPGSWSGRTGKCILKVANKASDFKSNKNFVIGKYKAVRKIFRRRGYECHHIIEQRFVAMFNLNKNDFPAVEITKDLHKEISRRWIRAIGKKPRFNFDKDYYRKKYNKADLKRAIRYVYKDMPKLMDASLKMLDKYYMPYHGK